MALKLGKCGVRSGGNGSALCSDCCSDPERPDATRWSCPCSCLQCSELPDLFLEWESPWGTGKYSYKMNCGVTGNGTTRIIQFGDNNSGFEQNNAVRPAADPTIGASISCYGLGTVLTVSVAAGYILYYRDGQHDMYYLRGWTGQLESGCYRGLPNKTVKPDSDFLTTGRQFTYLEWWTGQYQTSADVGGLPQDYRPAANKIINEYGDIEWKIRRA